LTNASVPFVTTSCKAGVITITLNAPETCNTLSRPEQCEELIDCLEAINGDPTIKIAVLTGAGSAFCAGGIVDATNPYSDASYVSGATNLGYNQALGLAFLVPQQYKDLLARAADLGNNRILAGMHSPLAVIGGRIQATAITATNIYNALYDANGKRLDWTNPANTTAYAVYQAYTQTQKYLAQSCRAGSVEACLKRTHEGDDNHDGDHDNGNHNGKLSVTMPRKTTPTTTTSIPMTLKVTPIA
jgi:Enoyl-CoA hydratase/isomerase